MGLLSALASLTRRADPAPPAPVPGRGHGRAPGGRHGRVAGGTGGNRIGFHRAPAGAPCGLEQHLDRQRGRQHGRGLGRIRDAPGAAAR